MIYLDNAATTYPKPESVYKAMNYAQESLSFNAGRGLYKQANECNKIISQARTVLASFCNADPNEVVFLSSATEALNLIINGLGISEGGFVYITPFEHNSIVRPLYNLKKQIDFNIVILPFDKKTWKPDLDKIQNMFAINKPFAIFSSQISNVTGLTIDYDPIFKLGKQYGSTNVLDAAQGYGIIEVIKDNADFVVYAGHKSLYGPFGVGGFITLSDKKLNITKSGGNGSDTLNHDMPISGYARYECGSPNVPAIYGLLEGMKWIKEHDIKSKEIELTRYMIDELSKLDNVHLFLPEDKETVFGIVSLAVDGYKADDVGDILSNDFDIAVRTGYHCAPFIHEFINSKLNGGTVRISIGCFSTKKNINDFIFALLQI